MRLFRGLLAAALALAFPVLSWSAGAKDSYTATIAPAVVQPSAAKTYALALTNKGGSPDSADHATVSVPSGFAVDGTTVTAAITAGPCTAADWTASLSADGSKIAADAGTALCPNGTLTIRFAATAPSGSGNYTWQTQLLKGTTAFENPNQLPVVTVDGTPPPPPTFTQTPPSPSTSASASFAFSDSENGAKFACSLDDAAYAACTSPTTLSSLANGSHTFRVKASDAAGNESSATAYTWTVDTGAPPQPSIDSKPDALTNDTSASFSFSDAEAGASFECALDAGAFAACTSPKTYVGLSDGLHVFKVRALDAAMNRSAATSASWTVDTTAPTVTLTAKPASPTNVPAPSFSFAASESGSTFSCALDGAAAAACSSPQTYGDQGNGGHTFSVRATDAAGNTGSATTYTWTVDTAAPAAPTITGKPPAQWNSSSASFSFSASESGVSFRCDVDGGSSALCTSPKTYTGLAEGPHTFDVVAVDAAGNASAPTSSTWTVDTIPPSLTIDSQPPNPTDQTSATFAFTAEPGSTTKCKLDFGPLAACGSPVTYSVVGDGEHTFHVVAQDAAGNTSEATYTWTVDTVRPVVTITSGPDTLTNQTTATFAFSSNKDGSTFKCSLDGSEPSDCSSPKAYTGLGDGEHRFEVRATAAVGTGLPTAYTWTVDTAAPDTTISSAPADGSSTTATFVFAATEAGSRFECALDGAAFEACSAPKTYGGLAAGAHTFAVRAIDAAGNADPTPATRSWAIAAPATPDTTPPGPVNRVTAVVGYGVLRLNWALPGDADFDHVAIAAATSARAPLGASIYSGNASSYTIRPFRNGSYYRFALMSYDHAGNESNAAQIVVSPAALLRSPRDGAKVKTPPLLSWARVSGSHFYNVQLYRGAKKVLSTWPTRPSVKLKRSWTYKGAQRLARGTYRWYVWPGFGRRAKARYGQLLGQGSFTVR